MNDSYDCIVIGGGPAGSTAAALVAQTGHSTLLLERDPVPRFHVGESLMPETYWTLERLGVLDQMRESAFTRKVSVQFVTGRGNESEPFYFLEHDPRPCSQTWQVERAEFDRILFENAASKGARTHDRTRVLEPLWDGDRAVGVRLQETGGPERRVAARVVIDATGQQSLIANQLGLKKIDPKLKKSAIWTYFRGARRDPNENAGATIIMHTEDKSTWFWFIPLSDDITSIGVVGDSENLLKQGGTPEEVFQSERARCPGLTPRLEMAEQVESVRVAREFSYSTTQHAGPGWVLVGDAFGFIDPIYSSGVFFALKTGEMAADAVIDGFAKNDLSGEQLSRWCAEFQEGSRWVRKLVAAFYTNSFSFGRFMREHPEHRGNLTDLLIGRIFHDQAGRIFQDMDPWIAAAEAGQSEGPAGSPGESASARLADGPSAH